MTESLIDQFPNIDIIIGSNEFNVQLQYVGSSYMEYKTDLTANKCTSRFRSDVLYTEINYWILGMPTYRNWEIAHDWTYRRIGFTPTSKSRAYRYAYDDNQQDASAGDITGVSSSPPLGI